MCIVCIPTQERGNEKTRSGQRNVCALYAFPRRSVGTREQEAVSVMYVHCMHSHAGAWEREKQEAVSVMYVHCMHSHAGAWEREKQEAVSVMYAFPRRSVGTRNEKTVSVCMHSHAGAWERECSRVGTRSGQRNVCIPTQERGNEITVSAMYAFPRRSVGTR